MNTVGGMTSLWQLTSPHIASDKFDGRRRDVVVAGAGLTGLLTAVLLARSGTSVTVLEARQVGAVTTGNTTGKLSLLQGTTLSTLREYTDDDILRAYVTANREGQQLVVDQIENSLEPVDRRTAYTYASTPAQRELLERELDACHVAGVEAVAAAESGLPYETFGVLRLDQQVQLHPMRMLALLASELRRLGATLVEHCRVRDVEQEQAALRVVTDQGDITADTCVLAMGTPILDRGMFFVKLRPTRSYVNAFRVSSDTLPEGMYVSVGEPTRSLRTAEDGEGERLLVVGGEAKPVGRADSTSAEIERLDTWADLHFTGAQRVCWWAAQDYRTHSRLPFAGALPRGGGRIFTATGFNKWGMTNGAAAAKALCAEILGQPLDWATQLNDHCVRLLEARDAFGVNAAVAGKLVSGWAAAELRSAQSVGEPSEGEGVVARQGTSPVAISRTNGKLCRVSGVCTHLGGILRWNDAERTWDCPLHGSRFDATGSLLEGPAVRDLDRAPSPHIEDTGPAHTPHE